MDNDYRLDTYQFELPPELIALHPAEPRDHARLLVLDRGDGGMQDSHFYLLRDFLKPGDCLVLNESRVIPARLWGEKISGAQAEILLLRQCAQGWEALVRPGRRLRRGSRIIFPGDPGVWAEILEELPDGRRLIAFRDTDDEMAFIERRGRMPLPPYIARDATDRDRKDYQTVYARVSGSAAAPTAGLHFTEEMLPSLRADGIIIEKLILHVGLGTFRPVAARDIREHQMHHEHYEISPATAENLTAVRRNGGRIIAVGTTSCRTLETVWDDARREYRSGAGESDMFIHPPYRPHSVDGLLTNFHLPGSSLMMLVSALAGTQYIMDAYRHAIALKYRFFSYGDAMLITGRMPER
ncbi:MAG: tRNA preQ1(34) S-adenosylmethionine ribosyltransferase-isomerase QueA, partial [Syntrophomonadaceae bacterium]|nr:tRNA preQ1(34) S-adenosylmethionine ribosyltransferase-isomerase QueA [Syntrophomonadaceae bacterium]